MLSQEENGYVPTGAVERPSRRDIRREIINEKRSKNTDVLPSLADTPQDGTVSARQISHLREENRRLRRELEELQRRIVHLKETEAHLEKEIETIHHGHQLEIEQYQIHLRELMDELNQKQQALSEIEQRFQELYHSFNEAIEDEAQKMVSEAAQTLILAPDHTPAILHDVMKTLEFQVKQTEDAHVAEIMALLRQAQYKTRQLEQEVEREREGMAQERQQIIAMQNNVRLEAEKRFNTIEKRLRAQFSSQIMLLTTVVLLILSTIQLGAIKVFKLPVGWAIYGPIILCAVLAFLIPYFTAHARYYSPPKQQKKSAKKDEKRAEKKVVAAKK